jgi:polysaccharide export outer membrane protein
MDIAMTRPLFRSAFAATLVQVALLLSASAGAADGDSTDRAAVRSGAVAGSATDQPAVQSAAGPGYRVGPEDVLEISVWKEEGLKKEVLVRPDGGISFPLVGEILALGKTAEEIQIEVTERLKKIINDPVVSVAILKVTGNKIYVIGRVARPGEFAAGRYIDVLQALSMAGGLTPYAAENDIKVLRKRNGKDEVFRFEYSDIRKGRNLEQNILLQGGDVVVVP